ncbi:hypothetical protein BUALT_Bualt05G0099000 [Buddleja alternifolia]|uniref:Reverse transcriptase domain-containing protein n=1 Tax=Buddleja alternifolia TaxID=168488 RepID=A0AAV6XHZ3_9LAMI|nr:hypothetical protein BUALT_Bualt05G0099000 [Buddleja alternifolia]
MPSFTNSNTNFLNHPNESISYLCDPIRAGLPPDRGRNADIGDTDRIRHAVSFCENPNDKPNGLASHNDSQVCPERGSRLSGLLDDRLVEYGRMGEAMSIDTKSAQLSILWNGEPLELIQPRCGLRQGDPLSPYLFVLCMERLSYMIDEKVQKAEWDPVTIGKRGPNFSHMFFADDIILTAKNTPKSAFTIKNTLDLFCKAPGLKVNLTKSKVFFAPKTLLDIKRDMIDILNISSTDRIGIHEILKDDLKTLHCMEEEFR